MGTTHPKPYILNPKRAGIVWIRKRVRPLSLSHKLRHTHTLSLSHTHTGEQGDELALAGRGGVVLDLLEGLGVMAGFEVQGLGFSVEGLGLRV